MILGILVLNIITALALTLLYLAMVALGLVVQVNIVYVFGLFTLVLFLGSYSIYYIILSSYIKVKDIDTKQDKYINLKDLLDVIVINSDYKFENELNSCDKTVDYKDDLNIRIITFTNEEQ